MQPKDQQVNCLLQMMAIVWKTHESEENRQMALIPGPATNRTQECSVVDTKCIYQFQQPTVRQITPTEMND